MQGDTNTLLLSLLPVICALTLLALRAVFRGTLFSRTGASNGPAVLLGPKSSGKTSLLFALSGWAEPPASCTSMDSSEIRLQGNAQRKLIDLPGHPRLRESRKAPLSRASAIVVVVDSAALARGAHEAADLLEEAMHESSAPILVAASKSDSLSALSERHARKRIEKEIAERRDEHSFSLDTCGRQVGFTSVSAFQHDTLAPIHNFLCAK